MIGTVPPLNSATAGYGLRENEWTATNLHFPLIGVLVNTQRRKDETAG